MAIPQLLDPGVELALVELLAHFEAEIEEQRLFRQSREAFRFDRLDGSGSGVLRAHRPSGGEQERQHQKREATAPEGGSGHTGPGAKRALLAKGRLGHRASPKLVIRNGPEHEPGPRPTVKSRGL